MRVVILRQWKYYPLMLFFIWFCVDGCYSIYWYFKDPVALEMMRSANFLASFVLYASCGLLWYYQGSLKSLYGDLTS